MKWGGVFFVKKSGKWGVFCKKVDLSSTQGALCTVSVFFYFTFFFLFGGAYAPNAPLPTGLCYVLSAVCHISLTIATNMGCTKDEQSYWLIRGQHWSGNGVWYIQFTLVANLSPSLSVKEFWKSVKIWGEIMGKSLVSCFFDSRCSNLSIGLSFCHEAKMRPARIPVVHKT